MRRSRETAGKLARPATARSRLADGPMMVASMRSIAAGSARPGAGHVVVGSANPRDTLPHPRGPRAVMEVGDRRISRRAGRRFRGLSTDVDHGHSASDTDIACLARW